ncbi:hypothetical protein PULV_a0866 [Pseudoalteromonas ulvae UL12]|uniref:DM13 domain-containing protein n=1 Tax=Pseudoalteromonas ulvae TaxID=107327 RepID=UPI00186BAFA7|nr:DM13 domain-containing protein [Pseudoalteromonas ulvae]MBE0363428.1 hypothetical protein [Pseudoalteromonas ulvae UL12]
MTKRSVFTLLVSHLSVALIAFAGGIYTLPILIAPHSPTEGEIKAVSDIAHYRTAFVRDLQDSDWLHFGEGEVFISHHAIAFSGTLAPGPDYTVYFSPEFVQTEADFQRLKATMVSVAKVNTFNDFLVAIPANISADKYNTVIIWCDSFEQFITSAQYQ